MHPRKYACRILRLSEILSARRLQWTRTGFNLCKPRQDLERGAAAKAEGAAGDVRGVGG